MTDEAQQSAITLARAHPGAWGQLVSRWRWRIARHILFILSAALDTIRDGGRLIITTPPRHSKSQSIARILPGWYLGHFPDRQVVCGSHSSTLAKRHSRQTRGDVEAFGPEVFGVSVDPRSSAVDRWEIAGHGGGYRAVGIGSGFTGEGAHLMVIDDYCPDAEAALSQVQRDAVWDWWESVMSSRFNDSNSAAIVMATRWHTDDLIGRLIANEPGVWRELRLPALALDKDPLGRAPGEALWPEQWSREHLEGVKSRRSAFWFSAQYQGSPIPEGGGIFKREWWDKSRHHVEGKDVYVFADGYRCPLSSMHRFVVADLAASKKTSADYTVLGSFGITPDRRLVVLDMLRARLEGPEIDDAASGKVKDWQASTAWYEDVATQLLQIQHARKAGIPVRCYGRKKEHDLQLPEDKVAVYYAATPLVEAKRLSLPVSASWLAELEKELATVPASAHDDQADVIAVACLLADKLHMSGLLSVPPTRQRIDRSPLRDWAVPRP